MVASLLLGLIPPPAIEYVATDLTGIQNLSGLADALPEPATANAAASLGLQSNDLLVTTNATLSGMDSSGELVGPMSAPAELVLAPLAATFGPYDNTTGGSLGDQGSCATQLTRTFTVADNFTVDDLNVGINVSHSYRGDVRVQLTSPGGTTVTLINQYNGPSDNYDLMLDDESGGSIDAGGDNNTGSPIYDADRSASPDNALSAFDGENASGTWTVAFCNVDQGSSGGRTLTFNSARLLFDGTAVATTTPGEINGTVFRDYDADATNDSAEPGIETIVVTAYDANGNSASTATDANGNYTILATSGGPGALSDTVRIEFALPADNSLDFLQPGAAGGTSVQFADIDAGATVDAGFSNPADYCQSAPDLATTCSINGDPLLGGTAANQDVVVGIPSTASTGSGGSTPAAATHLADSDEAGAVWGVAYQRSTQTIFTSSVLRRFSGFGPLSTGGIYTVDYGGALSASSGQSWVDVRTIGIPTGTDPRTAGGAANTLPASTTQPSWDAATWPEIGKLGIGDIDFAEDDATLWLTNLADQSLYGIQNADPNTTPTAGDVLGPFDITSATYSPTCPTDDIRPWAVKVKDGSVYVGVVCSAESTENDADLHAYILSFDPANTAAGFSNVFNFTLDYNRRINTDYTFRWEYWADDYPSEYYNNSFHMQPILSDIEFDIDGSMIVAILDRNGLQGGNNNYRPDPSATSTQLEEHNGHGDIIQICKVSGTFVLDGDSGCANNAANNEGHFGGEYYPNDAGPPDGGDLFGDVGNGGVALLPVTGEVVMSTMDPFDWYSGGLVWFDSSSGARTHQYELYAQSSTDTGPTLGKAAGIGDVEALCQAAPIEIGNYVWED